MLEKSKLSLPKVKTSEPPSLSEIEGKAAYSMNKLCCLTRLS